MQIQFIMETTIHKQQTQIYDLRYRAVALAEVTDNLQLGSYRLGDIAISIVDAATLRLSQRRDIARYRKQTRCTFHEQCTAAITIA